MRKGLALFHGTEREKPDPKTSPKPETRSASLSVFSPAFTCERPLLNHANKAVTECKELLPFHILKTTAAEILSESEMWATDDVPLTSVHRQLHTFELFSEISLYRSSKFSSSATIRSESVQYFSL